MQGLYLPATGGAPLSDHRRDRSAERPIAGVARSRMQTACSSTRYACCPAPWLVVHLPPSSRGVLASSAPDLPPGQPHRPQHPARRRWTAAHSHGRALFVLQQQSSAAAGCIIHVVTRMRNFHFPAHDRGEQCSPRIKSRWPILLLVQVWPVV